MSPHHMAPTIGAAVALAGGLVLCFAGYRLFKAVLALSGFLTGALLGGGAAAIAAPDSWLVVLAAAIAGGIVGALLFRGALAAGLFVLGALGGALLGGAIGTSLGSMAAKVGMVVGLGLLGGLVARKAERPVIALSTALLGAGTVVVSSIVVAAGPAAIERVLGRLAGTGAPGWPDLAALGAWGLLAALGAAAQLWGRGGGRG